MKRDMRPLSAGNLSGSSRGFGRSRPGTAGRLSTTRSAPHLKKLAPPKFLSSGENSVAKTSQPFGSSSATMSLDLSADPTLAALLESVGDTSLSGGLDDSNALVAVVAARPSRELSVTFEESEADVVPQVDSPQKGSPLKSPNYARTVKTLGLFEPNIPRKRIAEFMNGWGARNKWDRPATDSVMRRWNAQQIHQRKDFDSSTIAAEVTLRGAVRHAEAAGQKTPNSFTTAIALGQLATYLDTLSDQFAPFAATLGTELLKAIYVNGNSTFEKLQEKGSKTGISSVCKSMDSARLYKRITYHDAAKQLLARVDELENEMAMYSEGVTLQTLIEKRDLAIRYGSRKAVRAIHIMLFYAWRGYIERRKEKEFLRSHIKKIEEERHGLSEEIKSMKASILGADDVRKKAEEALATQKRHNVALERDMAKMEADDVQERAEMGQLRDDLRAQVIANEELQTEFSGSQAKVKELEDALALAATTLAQVKADAAADKETALSAAAEEQAKLREENEVLTLALQALKSDAISTAAAAAAAAAAGNDGEGVAPAGKKARSRAGSKEKPK
jgi:hypothetical protein